jgi:nitrate reductase NapE
MPSTKEKSLHPANQPDKASELKAFLFLTVVLAPAIAFFTVTGYGFLVWVYQMFMGPPTS